MASKFLSDWTEFLKKIIPIKDSNSKKDDKQGNEAMLVLGVGHYGGLFLEELQNVIATIPLSEKQIKWLWVHATDDQRKSNDFQKDKDFDFKSTERIILNSDYREINRLIVSAPEKWKHLSWFNREGIRSSGRLSIFNDLIHGPSNSILWRRFSQFLRSSRHGKIRIVGTSFEKNTSGLYLDLIRLLQIVAETPLDIELWLLGASSHPVNVDGLSVSVSEQKRLTMAMLRELGRYQRNAVYSFDYVPVSTRHRSLRAKASHSVVQTIYYFEPDNNIHALVGEIAEIISLLTNEDICREIERTRSKNQSVVGKYINSEKTFLDGVVSGIGISSVWDPTPLMREIIVWRLIRDVLFSVNGLYSLEEFRDGKYTQLRTRQRLRIQEIRKQVEEFVQSFDKYDGSKFLTSLEEKINLILNKSLHLSNFNNSDIDSVSFAIDWLNTLYRSLRGQQASRRVTKNVRELISTIEEKKKILEDIIYSSVVKEYDQAWENWTFQVENNPRYVISPEAVWDVYNKVISHGPRSLFSRVRSRIGWLVNIAEALKQKNWTINWVVVSERIENPEQFAGFVVTRPEKLVEKVRKVVDEIVVIRSQKKSTLELAFQRKPSDWHQSALPTIEYSIHKTSDLLSESNRLELVISPSDDRALELEGALKKAGDVSRLASRVASVNTNISGVSVLLLEDYIPFQALALFSEENVNYDLPRDPAYYTQRGEQLAGLGETSTTLMSASFRTILQENEEWIIPLAKAFVLDLVARQDNGDLKVPGLGLFTGENFSDILRNLNLQEGPNDIDEKKKSVLLEVVHKHELRHYGQCKAQARHFQDRHLSLYFENDSQLMMDCGVLLNIACELVLK